MPSSALRLEHEKFCGAVSRFVKRVGEKKAGVAVKKTALDLTRHTTRGTPMRTGRAAAGWWPFAVSQGAPMSVSGAGAARGFREGSYRSRLRGARPFVELVNSVPYIMPLEEGAGPHVIRARRAKALRFFWRGRICFAKSVRHPGMRGYHALRNGMSAVRRNLEAAFGGLVRP